MNRFHGALLPTLILALTGAAAWWLLRKPPASDWVRIEAPRQVAAGASFVAAVSLLRDAEGSFLTVDLHGQTSTGRSLRSVAGGGSQPVESVPSSHTFTFAVPALPDLERVYLIAYTSSTGRWSDHQQVAASERVRIAALESASHGPSVPLRMTDQIHDPGAAIEDPLGVRASIALAWLGCAIGILRKRTARTHAAHSLLLVVLFVALAFWELSDLGAALTRGARALAADRGWYDDRRGWQQGFTVACLALCALVAIVSLRRAPTARALLARLGSGIYACASLGALLSLHELDRLLAAQCGPLSVAAGMRLAGAALVAGVIVLTARGARRDAQTD